jgi:DNA (cytosine-5)-methyltransferase 1
MGFDAKWGVLGAADIGAPHKRDRIWIFCAHPDKQRWNVRCSNWEKRSVLSNERWQASENQPEGERRGNRIGQIGSDVAYTKELFSNGGNNNAGGSMERKPQSELRNNCGSEDVAYPGEIRPCGSEAKQRMERGIRSPICGVDGDWWQTEPSHVPRIIERNVGGVANGVAARVDRLKAIGNGQVPLCAATAWRLLSE